MLSLSWLRYLLYMLVAEVAGAEEEVVVVVAGLEGAEEEALAAEHVHRYLLRDPPCHPDLLLRFGLLLRLDRPAAEPLD